MGAESPLVTCGLPPCVSSLNSFPLNISSSTLSPTSFPLNISTSTLSSLPPPFYLQPLNQIRSMTGKTLSFTTTASGAVSWAEAKAGDLAHEKEKHDAERKGRGGAD